MSEDTGKGRATPSRKEAEAARKKAMKTPMTRKEQLLRQREARAQQRGRTQDALRGQGSDRDLPLRDRGPVRRFARDWVDRRFNVAEILLPVLIVVLILSFNQAAWAQTIVVYAWSLTIIGTALDEVIMVRGLRKQLRARFSEHSHKGTTLYAVLRSTQVRRFRLPKPYVARGTKLPEHYH